MKEIEKRMNEKEKKFDLKERFIDYEVRIINVSEQLSETKLSPLLQETYELISIRFMSIDTVKKKMER